MEVMQREEFKYHLNAVIHASRRTRWIVVVMVVASILAFIAFWNSRRSCWAFERLTKAHQAAQWCPWSDSLRAKLSDSQREKFDQSRKWAINAGLWDKNIDAKDSLAISELNVKEFRRIARVMASKYARSRIDHSMIVKIPFFGIAFDVNDLEIFSGITFVVLLLMLQFGLSRELCNIHLTFDKIAAGIHPADENKSENYAEARNYFQVLAMSQVLTVPPSPEKLANRLQIYLPKILLITPLSLQFLIFVWDLITFEQGLALSASNTVAVYIIGGICLVFIALLTLRCLRLAFEMDREWHQRAVDWKIIETDSRLQPAPC